MNTSGISLKPEVVAEFPRHWPSGIAVSRSGRIFVTFPRLDPTPAPVTLVEIVDGRAVPFPDELVNTIDPTDAKHRFVSVHGITMGPGNRLLALDTGARSIESCDPSAAKLYVIDLDRNAILHGIGFPDDVCLPTSYLNDIVIDYDRGKAGYAFISDSGQQGPNGIIVVDLDSGKSWHRLRKHPSVTAPKRAGFGIATEQGIEHVVGGIDGIAISPDGKTLWWTPLGSYDLYSIDTEILCDTQADERQIASHVKAYPARDFASDGLDSDRNGRIYFTDLTHGTVQRLDRERNRYETLLGGTGYFMWPDAVRIGPDATIYVTDSQLDRAPQFTGGEDRRTPPYRLYRASIDAEPAQY